MSLPSGPTPSLRALGILALACFLPLWPAPSASAMAWNPSEPGAPTQDRSGRNGDEVRVLPKVGVDRPFGSIGSSRPFGTIGQGRPFGGGTSRSFGAVGEGRSFGRIGSGRPFGGSDAVPQGPTRPPVDTGPTRGATGTWLPTGDRSAYGWDPRARRWPEESSADRDRLILDSLRAREPLDWTSFDASADERQRLGPVRGLGLQWTPLDPMGRITRVLIREANEALAQGRYEQALRWIDRVLADPRAPGEVLLPRAWALVGLGRDAEAAAIFAELDQVQPGGWRDAPRVPGHPADARGVLERLGRDLREDQVPDHLGYLHQVLAGLEDGRPTPRGGPPLDR